jgi:predicted permease
MHDVRQALRMMRRSPGFTLVAVLSLAIGIGANAAIFSVSDALLLRALPIDHPEELVFVNRGGLDDATMRFSHPALERFRATAPEVAFAGMGSAARMQVRIDGAAEFVAGQLVTGNWFDVIGARAAAGRTLTAADSAALGREPVVVLSHSYWTRRFGADPAVVGRTIDVNGQALSVVGVAAARFGGVTVGNRVDLWMPVTLQQELRIYGNASMEDADSAKPWLPQDGIAWLMVIARTPAAVDREAVRVRLDTLNRQAIQRRNENEPDESVRAYRLRERIEFLPGAFGLSPLRDAFTTPLRVLMVTMAGVLLIGCANLASLLLARGAARRREFALRLALGARRNRIVRQLLTETTLLSLLAGVLSVAVARWGSQGLLLLASSSRVPIPLELVFDWRLIAFTFAISVVTGMLFGLAPAIRLSRADLADAMKHGGRVAGGDRLGSAPAGKVLVITQVALSLALLVGALLFLRTFRNLVAVDAGLDRAQVISARVDPRTSGFSQAQLPALYERLLERAHRVPGATSASIALYGALTGTARISGVVVEGRPRLGGGQDNMREEYVGLDYFRTVGMSLIRGRDFRPQDDARAPQVAVINAAMAKKFFGDDDPLGRKFGYGTPPDTEIIGVVADARVDGLRRDVPAMAYRALAQSPSEFAQSIYIRVNGPVDAARAALARAVADAEPNLAVREVVTQDELARRTVINERLLSSLTGIFGVLAVLVACLGLYGTVSYSVVRRTNEIGVRLALGADPSRVRWMVLRETLWLVALGCVVGVAIALATLGLANTLLFGLSPRDPATLAAAAITLMIVGALAGLVPAWRASRVDPMRALRIE